MMAVKSLPRQRWLPRAVVLGYVGNWKKLKKLEEIGKLVPEYPGGIKHKRYRREQVLAV